MREILKRPCRIREIGEGKLPVLGSAVLIYPRSGFSSRALMEQRRADVDPAFQKKIDALLGQVIDKSQLIPDLGSGLVCIKLKIFIQLPPALEARRT